MTYDARNRHNINVLIVKIVIIRYFLFVKWIGSFLGTVILMQYCNVSDTQHFRKVIVWLEDQKIRHYTIEDRKKLRDITSSEWPNTFEKYCDDVKCPITKNESDQLEWFIGYALRLEFEDDCK